MDVPKLNITVAENKELFSSIAPYYDILNRVLSFNRDKIWRKKAVALAGIAEGARILDVCTGTAETAIAFSRKFGDSRVYGIDFSHSMLGKAKEKITRLGLAKRINLVEADALSLPFKSGSFDAVSISFGLRNLGDYPKAMAEIVNALKEGGRAVILEFSPPAETPAGKIAGFYITKLVPLLARMLGGSAQAYGYLSSSISVFISPGQILDYMSSAGLKNLRRRDLFCGVVNSYCGEK